jgi:arylformamidase
MALVLRQHAFMNAAAARRLNTPQRFSYGRAAIETLDYYRGPSTGAPIHIFLHGGTWRSNTALGYAFVAEPLLRAGAHVVVPDFSSVDDAPGGLADLVAQVRTAIAWVYSRAIELGGDRERIFVSGHSSGAHLAAAALTTNWAADFGLPYSVLRGGLCISGIFDLKPVRLSWRNEYLKLTDQSEQALSPQRHLNFLSAPLVVAYGTEETPEFQRQSRDFATAARSAGHNVELLVGDGYNHFEMLGTLASPYGLAGRAALAQMRLARG